MITLLFGKDRYRLARRRHEILAAFHLDHPDGTVVAFDLSEDPRSFFGRASELGTPDLFSAPRLIDMRDVFSLSEEDEEKIIEIFKQNDFGFFDVVVSSSVQPKAKDPLFVFLKKASDRTETFDVFTTDAAKAFFLETAGSVSPDISFSRDAIAYIIDRFSNDSAKLSGLAEQLSLFCGTGEVSLRDVKTFVDENPKEKIFVALDALVSGNRSRAAELLMKDALEESGGAIKVFGLLAWQLRELLKVRGEYDRGIRQAALIAKACGMHPYVAGKLLSRIGDYPVGRLRRNLGALASFDGDMKLGKIDQNLALAMFIEKF